MAQAVSSRPLTAQARVQSRVMWDLWWTKWHWDRFLPEYFGFPLSISFHLCSITRKNEKRLIIFITGIHNKPQGCGVSVAASAAGPFTAKKKSDKPDFTQKLHVSPRLTWKLRFVVVSLSFSKRTVRWHHETGNDCFIPKHVIFTVLALIFNYTPNNTAVDITQSNDLKTA
jgi:hypothetical protein